MPSVLVQRRRHHRDIALRHQPIQLGGVTRPRQAALRDASRAGHRRRTTTEGAEQVPRVPADVAEPDEPDVCVTQRAGLRYRSVVHRRRPHVAAQLTVLGQEVASLHHRRRDHVLGDGPLMVKHVGHQNVRCQGIELHLVRSRPGDVNQTQLLCGVGHFGGEAAPDIHVGVPQFVQRHAAVSTTILAAWARIATDPGQRWRLTVPQKRPDVLTDCVADTAVGLDRRDAAVLGVG